MEVVALVGLPIAITPNAIKIRAPKNNKATITAAQPSGSAGLLILSITIATAKTIPRTEVMIPVMETSLKGLVPDEITILQDKANNLLSE
jgi:hypothetical protein